MPNKLALSGYFLILSLFSIYSYSQVDPNLVLSDNPTFWGWQQRLWLLGFQQRTWSAMIYTVLILGLFGYYRYWLSRLKESSSPKRLFSKILTVSVIGLSLSYPALSHDIFNYAMNAKMVWKYHSDPHVKVALDFPKDPWLGFMHNVHTPAPYAYGWTVLSVPFGYLGGDNIKTNLLSFRMLMISAYLGLGWVILKMQKSANYQSLAVFMINPLVLIETVTNIHNDVVMMFLELTAIYLAWSGWKKRSGVKIFVSIILFLASVSIKYASLMLIPALIIIWVTKWFGRPFSSGTTLVITHFMPLLTARSQRFLPWYLIWPMTFLPLDVKPWISKLMIVFSVSALLSYLPYLYDGDFTQQIQTWRILITFLPGLIYIIILTARRLVKWRLLD